jgi:hypothetical protein
MKALMTSLLFTLSASLSRVSSDTTTKKIPFQLQLGGRELNTTLFAIVNNEEEVTPADRVQAISSGLEKLQISNGTHTMHSYAANIEANYDKGYLSLSNGTYTLGGSLSDDKMKYLKTLQLSNGTHSLDTTYWNFDNDDEHTSRLKKRQEWADDYLTYPKGNPGKFIQGCHNGMNLSPYCRHIKQDSCQKAMDKLIDKKIYHTHGGKMDSGTCHDSCGAFVQGHGCAFTGAQMKSNFKDIIYRTDGGCTKCMWRQFDDPDHRRACTIKADVVTGCGLWQLITKFEDLVIAITPTLDTHGKEKQ